MNKWSLYIGKISGIKIFIHWTFIFLMLWILINNFRSGNNLTTGLYTIGFVLAIFVCITLHELGHAFTARYFNYHTKDITLLPIGGMARMDEIPENPKHEFFVAIAGPAVNIIISLLLYPLFYWFGNVPSFFTVVFNNGEVFLYDLLIVNLAIAAFNLIPAFPMDGGRIFRAILSFFIDRVRATNIAAKTGQAIATVFFFIGIFINPILALVGIVIFLIAQTENDYVKSKSILHDYKVKDVIMKKYFSLDTSNTIHDAVKVLLDVQATDFLVMEKERVVGTLDRNRIIHALANKGNDSSVALAMNTKITFLSPEMPLEKVFLQFKSMESTMLPVIQEGQLIGIVDQNNILEFMMVKTSIGKSPTHTHKEELKLDKALM